MPSDLQGKTALITGASRGIGLATAHALAAQGCNLLIASRNTASIEAAAEKLAHHKVRIVPMHCDIRSEIDIAHLAELARDQFGSIDILFNNAGVVHPLSVIENFPTEQWQGTIETNLTGTFLVTRAFLPLMKAGSSVVNNVSVAAYMIFPKWSAYMVSKAGVLAFTNALRHELRERKIRVMALIVGATNTDIWQDAWPDAPRDRMIDPSDVAFSIVNALLLPASTSIDEIRITPSAGAL